MGVVEWNNNWCGFCVHRLNSEGEVEEYFMLNDYDFEVVDNAYEYDINKEKYYIYALDKKIGKVVIHVVINGEATSLVTGNKFKLKKNKRGNIGISETKVRFEVKKDD